MPEPQFDDEERQYLEAVAWVDVLSHPRYEETIGRKLKEMLAANNAVVLDWRCEPRERDVATGRFEALADVAAWPAHFARIVESYRTMHVEESQRLAAEKENDKGTLPGRGEAWYEQTG